MPAPDDPRYDEDFLNACVRAHQVGDTAKSNDAVKRANLLITADPRKVERIMQKTAERIGGLG